jgi:murein DD-endopeptidase MepM/ murein hydrolase activator NlpD
MTPAQLRAWWNHHLTLSVAMTETSGVHTLRVRAAWLIFVAVFAVSGWVGMMLAGDLAGARLKANLTGNTEVQYYLDMIAELRAQRDAEREQLKTIAQELGVLQARLDRFNALGNKLKADGILFSDTIGNEQKGGYDIPPLQNTPDVNAVLGQVNQVQDRADFTELALETTLAMAIRASLGTQPDTGIPYFWPLMTASYRLTSPFGWRIDPVHGNRAWHAGMDLADEVGSPVVAAADGLVTFSGWRMGYGNAVEITHKNGFMTRYGHLSRTIAAEGNRVQAGDLIALLGNTGKSTGPHLHFEVRRNDIALNPFPFIRETRQEAFEQAQNGRGNQLLRDWRRASRR